MKYTQHFIAVLVFVISIFFMTKSANAGSIIPVSDDSAKMEASSIVYGTQDAQTNQLIQKLAITRVLEKYNSPLINSVDTFMGVCNLYNLDCYLVPAISGIESTFGLHVAAYTNNPFGWGGGYMRFESWDDAIYTVAKGLKTRYIDRGATTVEAIGHIYAPPSITWAGNVNKLMNTFRKEEEKISAHLDIL